MNQAPVVYEVVSTGSKPLNQTASPIMLINPAGEDVGVVKKAAAQADTTAADLAALKVDFNALLAKLRTAGVIAT